MRGRSCLKREAQLEEREGATRLRLFCFTTRRGEDTGRRLFLFFDIWEKWGGHIWEKEYFFIFVLFWVN